MSCGNVSSLFCFVQTKKVTAANYLRSARFWQESSTNAEQDMSTDHTSCVLWIKKHCPRALLALEPSRRHGRDLRILLTIGGILPAAS